MMTLLPDLAPGAPAWPRAPALIPLEGAGTVLEGGRLPALKVRLGWWLLGASVALWEGAPLGSWFICRKMAGSSGTLGSLK